MELALNVITFAFTWISVRRQPQHSFSVFCFKMFRIPLLLDASFFTEKQKNIHRWDKWNMKSLSKNCCAFRHCEQLFTHILAFFVSLLCSIASVYFYIWLRMGFLFSKADRNTCSSSWKSLFLKIFNDSRIWGVEKDFHDCLGFSVAYC